VFCFFFFWKIATPFEYFSPPFNMAGDSFI
jgi:hypothetical protein